MNILHIIQRYEPAHGGSEIYMKVASEYFAQKNSVTVWTSDAYDLDSFWDLSKKIVPKKEEEIGGVVVKRFSTAPGILKVGIIHKIWNSILWRIHSANIDIWWLKSIASYPMVFGMLWHAISKKHWDFDVIQVTASPYNILFYSALLIANRSNAKLLVTPFVHLGEREDDPARIPYFRKETVKYYQRADLILIQTKAEQTALEKLCKDNGYIVPKEKFSKLGMGIFPEKIKGGDGKRFKEKYKISEPIVFYVGPRTNAKGIFNLIKACELLWIDKEKFHLVLAGMTMSDFDLFWKDYDSEFKKNILVLNSPSEQEKYDLFDAGDIFSMVSKSDSFGIVYLESWFYKKPVLGCLLPSISEIITDRKDGLLSKFDDVKSIAKNIKTFLNNPKKRKEFGEEGHKKVMKEFTWEKKLEILEKLYK